MIEQRERFSLYRIEFVRKVTSIAIKSKIPQKNEWCKLGTFAHWVDKNRLLGRRYKNLKNNHSQFSKYITGAPFIKV